MNFFQWLSQRPKIQQAYNTTMRIARNQRGEEWFEYYPVEEKLLLPENDESSILLVDVGGNVGYDLINFKKRYPDLRGRLIVEDTPAKYTRPQTFLQALKKLAMTSSNPSPAHCKMRRPIIFVMFCTIGRTRTPRSSLRMFVN
jgi:hypothetical protein